MSTGALVSARSSLDRLDELARLVADELDARQLCRKLSLDLREAFEVERAHVALADGKRLEHVRVNGREGRADELDELRRWLSVLARRQGSHAIEDGRAMGTAIRHHQGRVIGLIVLAEGEGPFSDADRQMLDILARQVAVAFERSILIGSLDDWTRGLEALLSFSAEINQRLEPAALIRHLIEHAARFLEADGGLAGLKDGRGESARMVSAARWRQGDWHDLPRSWTAGEGLAGHLLVSEFPYLANDYVRDPQADPVHLEQGEIAHALAVPIKNAADSVLGFFELHRHDEDRPFTWQNAAFLESLANTTAVAIDNARLLEQVEVKSRQVRALSAGNVRRLEEERRHIARELHDEAGQALVGIKLGLKVMARSLPGVPPQIQEELEELRHQVDGATVQLKNLAQRLRPPTLDRLGLDMALQQLADEYGESTALAVEVTLPARPERQSAAIETALFRIAQEALTNAANHAAAERVALELAQDEERVALSIADDGRGFDLDNVELGLGLIGMRERVTMLGGEIEVETRPGAGTRIRVAVPRGAAE